MNKKVYFAGSIRGGRSDAELYKDLIGFINKTDKVLTEHIGNSLLSVKENALDKDTSIYKNDTEMIKECDLLIAECTSPSLGVGYELAFAEKLGKEVYVLYRKSVSELSAMIKGNDYFKVYRYESREEAFGILKSILST